MANVVRLSGFSLASPPAEIVPLQAKILLFYENDLLLVQNGAVMHHTCQIPLGFRRFQLSSLFREGQHDD